MVGPPVGQVDSASCLLDETLSPQGGLLQEGPALCRRPRQTDACPISPGLPCGAHLGSFPAGKQRVRNPAPNLCSAPSHLGFSLTLSVLICEWGSQLKQEHTVRSCVQWPECLPRGARVVGHRAPHLRPGTGRPGRAHAPGRGGPCLQLRAQLHSGLWSLEQRAEGVR